MGDEVEEGVSGTTRANDGERRTDVRPLTLVPFDKNDAVDWHILYMRAILWRCSVSHSSRWWAISGYRMRRGYFLRRRPKLGLWTCTRAANEGEVPQNGAN